jgi:hypothetical protein
MVIAIVKSIKNLEPSFFEKFDRSDPGLLITMLTLEMDDNGKPIPENINVNECIKLGSISKQLSNIMDLTLLNKKLPINIYNSNSYYTNYGIILKTDKLIPKNFPNKYVQCLNVRDSGSDLRRCDTDFDNHIGGDHLQQTRGKYILPLRANKQKCKCTYLDKVSNTCNTKAEVVGCGAKCTESGKICGEVTWCDFDDFNKPQNKNGIGCAIHPKNIHKFINETVLWNKARINQNWDIPHPENELDAYVANNDENQQMIIDSVECFVFTEYCGSTKCDQDVTGRIQKRMEIVTNDFNKFYNKNVDLYKLIIDPSKNGGKYVNGDIIPWEKNNYTSDLRSMMVKIDLDPQNITKPLSMYTYRVAENVDGIAGKNTGDIKGDNSYISGEFCPRHGDDYCKKAVMSQYKVNYLPIRPVISAKNNKDMETCMYDDDQSECKITQDGFGNYALCNPGGVIGGNVEENGEYMCTRCADTSIPDYNIYCREAPGVELDRFSGGKWYSWPRQTMCKDGEELGQNGCNWNLSKEKVKNFTIEDLRDQDYKILINDEYQKIVKKCTTNGKLDKQCQNNEISKFVQDNAPSNIATLNKAFGV